jgi:tRNA(fMet)-specific endonuclease VapC
MARRLILDTAAIIAYERGTIDRSSLDDDELAIASISVAEYRAGMEMADSPDGAAERARVLAAITSAVDVLEYTPATAAHHGRLLARVRRTGTPRGAHDLIVAAHAAETGRTIISPNAQARFGDLPGVSAIDLGAPRDLKAVLTAWNAETPVPVDIQRQVQHELDEAGLTRQPERSLKLHLTRGVA